MNYFSSPAITACLPKGGSHFKSMEVAYSHIDVFEPDTEITMYMWPGFLAEFDDTTQSFEVWELLETNRWLPRPDILSPPLSCMGVDRTPAKKWVKNGISHTCFPGNILRTLR